MDFSGLGSQKGTHPRDLQVCSLKLPSLHFVTYSDLVAHSDRVSLFTPLLATRIAHTDTPPTTLLARAAKRLCVQFDAAVDPP